jgi:putative component of membrane protein insertase Oxa1/YidC/SpoIIIJ protein YidD
MRWFLLGAIYFYRRLPARFKRHCLFKETCSLFVARVARESGFWPGLRALKTRVSQCRPGYQIYFESEAQRWQIRFKNGGVSRSSQLADFVMDPYRNLPAHTWAVSDGGAYGRNTSVLIASPPEKSGD